MDRRLVSVGAIVVACLLPVSSAATAASPLRAASAPWASATAASASAVEPAGSIASPARLGDYFQVSAKIDSTGHIQAVAARDDGVWYITNASGTFTGHRIYKAHGAPPVTARNAEPVIALDAHDHAYIAFVRDDCADCTPDVPSGIWYTTNKSGSWSTPVKVAGLDMNGPSIAVHGGHVYLAWQKCFCFPDVTTQVWYSTNASGSWTKTKVATNATEPSLAVDSHGLPRIVYASHGIKYAVGHSKLGNFHISSITSGKDHGPALDLNATDHPRIAFSRYNPGSLRGIYDGWKSAGTWQVRRLKAVAGTGAPTIAVTGTHSWEVGAALAPGGAYVAVSTKGAWDDDTLNGPDSVDHVSSDARNGSRLWMFTVVGGASPGIYYAFNSGGP
jgi:hypothetical protein